MLRPGSVQLAARARCSSAGDGVPKACASERRGRPASRRRRGCGRATVRRCGAHGRCLPERDRRGASRRSSAGSCPVTPAVATLGYCRRHVRAPVATPPRPRRAALGGGARTWVRRHVLHSDGFVLVALSLCAAALGALFLVNRTWFPLSALAAGGAGRRLPALACAACCCSTSSSRRWSCWRSRGARRGSVRVPSSSWSRRRRSCTCSPAAAAGSASRAPAATRCWSTCATG